MKTRLLALLALTMLAAPVAEAAYLGNIRKSMPYSLLVGTQTRVSMTVLVVTKRGTVEADELLVFDTTTTTPLSRTVPNNAVRLVFLAEATLNGSGVVTVEQDGTRFEVGVAPDAQIVFDVAP